MQIPAEKSAWKRLTRLLERDTFDPTPMTKRTFRFGQIGEAFNLMDTEGDGIIKPLIVFQVVVERPLI